MALVLNLKKGEDFYIERGEESVRVVVERIDGPRKFKLRTFVGFEEVKTITDRCSEKIYQQVRVSAGEGRRDLAKLTIEAPAHFRITRGSLKKQ